VGVVGVGEEEVAIRGARGMVGTSPEMGTVRLAAPSPAETRPRFRVCVVRGGGGPGSSGDRPRRQSGGGGGPIGRDSGGAASRKKAMGRKKKVCGVTHNAA
jgi:hypothetical protein